VVCAQAKLPLPHASCNVAALPDWISQLQGRERSMGSHLHAPFVVSVAVDRWQLSAGPNFSVTPWHRAPYVFMHFRCIFHLVLTVFYLDVAYVALVVHVCCKYMFQMFHLFQTYVVCVLYVCFICCNGCTRMLQVYVLSFSNVCYNVLSGCCILPPSQK
jgi:hypothetical protein